MRVAYVLDIYPKFSETFIINEIVAIQRKGVQVRVFALQKNDESCLHENNAKIQDIIYLEPARGTRKLLAHASSFLKKPLQYVKAFVEAFNPESGLRYVFSDRIHMACEIAAWNPDHVHAHFGLGAADLALLTNVYANVTFSFTTHGYDIYERTAANLRYKSFKALAHITVCEYNKNYLQKLDVPPSKIEIIHCGIDFTQNFPERDKSLENSILSIGRLHQVKAHDILIKACARLKQKGYTFTCTIVGEGEERNALERLIEREELGNVVTLAGKKSQEEVFALLSRAKVMALTSRSEAVPVALMEAMAMKVPVIGPNVKGVPELIEDGVSGYLVEPGDTETIVKKLSQLLSNGDICENFSLNGYIKVFDEFNLDKETDKLFNVWRAN